jgi:HlyD family secretion protein
MVLASTSSMYAEVNVDETDVARVSVGQEAAIVPAALPDTSWKGVVEQVAIAPRSQAGQSKSYLVRIRLEQQDEAHFRPGMSCRAETSTRGIDAAQTLAVPVQAVRYEDSEDPNKKNQQASVFVDEAGKARKRNVEIGAADDAYIEILKGLSDGEQIVTGPAKMLRFLKEGDRVAAIATAPPASTMARK